MKKGDWQKLEDYLNRLIIGQEKLTRRLLIALLSDGHLLVEGAPGLAKTRAIKVLASALQSSFVRIQFTPDLLPSDLVGSEIYKSKKEEFCFEPGPLFHNLILADEINRAPAKVQSALLEAMGERQISVAGKTYPLPAVFLVMATQNPIENEGTYPLPEAQLDRFMMYVKIGQPDDASERAILQLSRTEAVKEEIEGIAPFTEAMILSARKETLGLHLSDKIEDYIVRLTMATRHDHKRYIRFGASPRGTIALERAARTQAFLEGRDYVTPSDVQDVFFDVMSHRLILSFEAAADEVTADSLLSKILETVPVP